MITWGISANSHDAALAVFADEKLVFASHSERFSGIKNDPHLCQDLVDYARITFGEPNQVCWYERPLLKSVRQLFAGQGLTFKENNIKKYLQGYGIDVPIHTNSHHRSHAAAGYCTSPFDSAAILVIDSIGEFQTLSIWRADTSELKCMYSEEYPHSVGLWYSAMTQRIGLKPNEEEYILMGMAAYGNPNRLYADIMNDFVYFPDWAEGGLVQFKENLHKGCKDWRPDLTTEQDMFDIAAATQLVYEVIFDRALQYTRSRVEDDNLVFMGGCALNCKANPIAYKYFKNVYIMPNPGDAGSAIGAVLAKYPVWRHSQVQPFNPYLGYDMGMSASNEEIVDYLIEHKMCGVARGRAEFGPRALGNRSLFADPRGADIKEKVNAIKRRQQFRPFAPVILEELADQYFDMPGPGDSRYMQMVARCRHPQLFPAIIHRDGTSRVQTCPKDGSPLRQLLELWYERTGCPMLLNTSLNVKGQPIVNDHKDAKRWSRMYGLPVFT